MKSKHITKGSEKISLLLSILGLKQYPEEIMAKEAIISEYLRNWVYRLATAENEGSQEIKSVYIRKISNIVTQQLGAIWPEENALFIRKHKNEKSQEKDPLDSEFIKYRLDNLNKIGDIARIGQGFWVPTPLRLVQLPEQDYVALIGGGPSKYAYDISESISQEGLGRLVRKEDLTSETVQERELWQPYDQWVGWLPEDLEKWTKGQLAIARREGGDTPSTFEAYEIFTSFRPPQSYNATWLKSDYAVNIVENDIFLCRTQDRRIYFLGEFQNGQLIKDFQIKDREAIPWLRLGLRLLHGRKNMARWFGNKLKIYAPLPLALEKHVLLYAYSIKEAPRGVAFYATGPHKESIEKLLKKYGYIFKIEKGE